MWCITIDETDGHKTRYALVEWDEVFFLWEWDSEINGRKYIKINWF